MFLTLRLCVFLSWTATARVSADRSCWESCGEIFQDCACDTKCLVYRNCCEDFELECHDNDTSQAITGIHQQMMAVEGNVQCLDDFLVISKCPEEPLQGADAGVVMDMLEGRQPAPEGTDAIATCLKATVSYYQTLQAHRRQQSNKLDQHSQHVDGSIVHDTSYLDDTSVWLEELASVHVSDLDTGFVYATLDVFRCHALPTSVPCVWQLATDSISHFSPLENDTSARDMNFYQLPPDVIPSNNISQCYSPALEDCNRTSPFFTQERYDSCKLYTNTVSSRDDDVKTYKNRFCLECAEGLNVTVIRGGSGIKGFPAFSSIVTLNSEGISLQMTDHLLNAAGAVWSTAVCEVKETIQCQVNECSLGFFKRPSGDCMARYTIHLAMKLGNNIGHEGHRAVARAAQCMVNKHLDLDMDTTVEAVGLSRFIFQRYGNEVMLGVELAFYDEGDADHNHIREEFSQKIGIPMTQALSDDIRFRQTSVRFHYCSFEKQQPMDAMGVDYECDQYVSTSGHASYARHPQFCMIMSKSNLFRNSPTLICEYQQNTTAYERANIMKNIKKDDCLVPIFQKESNNNNSGKCLTLQFINISLGVFSLYLM